MSRFERSGSHGFDALYQGPAQQAAEKLILLKGTGFSPYVMKGTGFSPFVSV
jgi:hypothetical protein